MSTLLAHTSSFYLRTPRLRARDDGGADLALVVWEPGRGESIVVRPLDARGDVAGAERTEWTGARVVTLRPGAWPPSPSDDVRDEERAHDAGHDAWIERDGATSRVVYRAPGGRETRVWEARGTAAAPAVAATPHGAWVAFHHDVREDSGERDVVKWIAVMFVATDGTTRSAGPVAERDRQGEEQGFEFPALVSLDGGVALFGRGSHRFWWQVLRGDAWSERTPMPDDDGAWGCRGRRVAAAKLTDGSILTARREKEGIRICALSPTLLLPHATPHRLESIGSVAPLPRGEGPRSGSSNGKLVDGRVLLFGDLHQHSAHSDGCGTADEAYLRARYHYGDDFSALSDHESFIGKRIGVGEWAYLARVTDAHDVPGTFATIHAYEWTARMYPGPGHKVAYLPSGELPIVSRDDVPDGAELLARVRAQGGFAVPHHVGWTGGDLSAHHEDAQPVWEICSCHGCYEHPAHRLGQRGELRDQFVDAALARGLRFGFIACSDGHGLLYHHGVARRRDPFRTGLTAVHADACTREAILDAIRVRRCYATSGAKIALDVRDEATGESRLGSFLTQPARVRVTVVGTGPIARVVMVGSEGKILTAIEPDSDRCEISAEVKAPFAYARVEQDDGEMAWASPTFVTPRRAAAGSGGASAG